MVRRTACIVAIACASLGVGRGLTSHVRHTLAAEQRVFTADATVISEYSLTLRRGESATIDTRDVSPGGDPVLHLLDASGKELAVDDNGGSGSAARLVFKAPTDGSYRVIVRSRSPSSAGTADLWRNGVKWRSAVSFGGWQVDLKSLHAIPLQTVRLPHGGGPVHALYVLKSDGLGIELRVVGNDVAGQVKLDHFGTGRVMIGIAMGGTHGPVRLVHNDVGLDGHDLDNDGLGSEVEDAIGTCSSSNDTTPQLRCSDIADARDTDGDGISDRLEELGGTNGSDALPLPLWGADPLHKDLFVEVDFMRRTKAENDGDVSMKMQATVARSFAAAYGDVTTTDPFLRLYHARLVGNPDGKTGISVHLDTGRAPEKPEDATIYGDWGGFSAVDAIHDGSDWKGVAANVAWRTAMRPGRRGVFRYALAYGSGGGQSPPGFAASYNFSDNYVAAHETGHTMGLGHAGPWGLSPDVNCKPNYPSLMNYAYQTNVVPMAFSDGLATSAPPLNNSALEESNVVRSTATSFLSVLQNVFGYYVDTAQGNVDWNRDGTFAPVGHPVQAYANYRPAGNGCEYTRIGQSRVAKGANAVPPALARLESRTFVFYVRDKRLRYSSSDSKWDCPEATDESCANAQWTDRGSLGLNRDTIGVDAARFGPEQLLIVASDSEGGLWERIFRMQGPTGSWVRVQGPVARGQPALAAVGDRVWLLYRDSGSGYRYRIRSASGWQGSHYVMDQNGAAVKAPSSTKFSPVLIYTPSGWPGATSGIYFLLADRAQDRLQLWKWLPQTQRFQNTGLFERQYGPAAGRPAMVVARNRLYIIYADAATLRAMLLMSYVKVGTATNGNTTKTSLVGLHGYFDNRWRTISGADFLYEINADSNVRAVLVHANATDSDREVWFRPKADGIEDYTYRNYDDWEVLRIGVCKEVVNPGGLVSGPIKCLSKAP